MLDASSVEQEKYFWSYERRDVLLGDVLCPSPHRDSTAAEALQRAHEAHLTGDDDSERLRADEAPSASNRIVVACSTDRHGGVRRGHLMFLPEMQQTAIAAALDRGEALRFIGIRDARFILIGPTTGPISAIEAARAQAHRRLAELATRF